MKSRDSRRRARRAAVSTGAAAADQPSGGAGATTTEVPVDATESGRAGAMDRWFVPVAILIVLVAAALRLPELALNPLHHDEGVNAFFTTNLVREGRYAYDPANYHGPTLYYFALVSSLLFGLTTEALRLVPVAGGVLTVALVLPLRRYLGAVAVLTAATLLAISPGAVYISRYFIHEALLVAFSLSLVVFSIRYIDRRSPMDLIGASASAALMFATKETGIITVIVLAVAALASGFYVRWRTPVTTPGGGPQAAPAARPSARRSLTDVPLEHVAGAAVVFVVIYVLFFTSFFTNFPKGLQDSIATFTIWTQTGQAAQVQPPHQYLVWMLRAEAPILILGTIGGLIAAVRGRERLWVFIGLWALGVTLAYSLVSYKTPWITLNMLVPLALLAGHAVASAWVSPRTRLLAPLAVVAAIALSAYQAVDLNYRHYDDETYPYVFVHSTRDMLAMVDEIERTAERAGSGRDSGIVVMAPEYWPLPWYFRDYPRAGFFGQIVDTEEPIIVAQVDQAGELAPALADRYRRVRTFNLRPGVDLDLYVRNDVPAQ